MSAIKQTKLFIEKLKNKDECEVVIRIGKFKSKEEAAHYTSYICMTKSIDFDAETIAEHDLASSPHAPSNYATS